MNNSPVKKTDYQQTVFINSDDKNASIIFKNNLDKFLYISNLENKDIVVLCIGTDRATGDSLGPIIGHKLSHLPIKKSVKIYGTLEKPVHAQNLTNTLSDIYTNSNKPFVIAIDASLGTHINYITIGLGSLKPGSGVRKSLPPVGDMFITGIVNSSTFADVSVLQTTRLSIVVKMADIITMGLWLSLNKS